MQLPNLSVTSPFIVGSDHLESDGIHLTPAAGDLFLLSLGNFLREGISDVTIVSESVNTLETSEDDDDDDMGSVAPDTDEDKLGAILKIVKGNSKRLRTVRPLKAALDQLAARSSDFESQVRIRRQRDNLVFARIKEESDGEINRSREDRVLITGLERSGSAPTSHLEKKEHYTKAVAALVELACPELEPKPSIVDVVISMHRDQVKPAVEVRFDSVPGALAFRKAAAALAKDKNVKFSALFFSNSITHSTRVRIEIMKVIAKKLTTDTEVAFVQGFISRPVMRYNAREAAQSYAAGTGRSYSFVDCVSRFGDLVIAHELAPAYRRAGATFKGAMEQYFILLNEDESGFGASGVNRAPIGHRHATRGRSGHRGSPLLPGFANRGRKRFGDSPPGAPVSKKPSEPGV
jgi:hypothetical protein